MFFPKKKKLENQEWFFPSSFLQVKLLEISKSSKKIMQILTIIGKIPSIYCISNKINLKILKIYGNVPGNVSRNPKKNIVNQYETKNR